MNQEASGFSLAKMGWKASVAIYPLHRPQDLWRRMRFLWRIAIHRSVLSRLTARHDLADLQASIRDRPSMLGVVEWPYIHRGWPLVRRIEALEQHYTELRTIDWLKLAVHEQKTIACMDAVHPGLSLGLERPIWLYREGEISLSIFVKQERVYSLAFSLARRKGELIAYVGGIQGRDIEGIEDIYKDLTKKLQGTRPRDFLITSFQLLCEVAGIERIFGICDIERHHRHPYFGDKAEKSQSANYDKIWSDRGGHAVDEGFFELPARMVQREDADVPSNKRALYRRRYAIFEDARQAIRATALGSPGSAAPAADDASVRVTASSSTIPTARETTHTPAA